MINKDLLKQKVEESGIKYTHIAKCLGITERGLKYKINGGSQFKADEIGKIRDILRLDAEDITAIFFDNDVA